MERLDIRIIKNTLGIDIDNFYVKCICGFLIALGLTYYIIPKIIRISYRKQLMAFPTSRSSHIKSVPNLGGVAIFYAVIITSSIFAYEVYNNAIFLLASLLILFFIGLIDDLLTINPYKKFLTQLIASIMLVVGSNIRITSFFGILGIGDLPYLVSVMFTILVFLFLINAFNLIDGIDGLSSIIAIIACLSYSLTFFRLGKSNYPMVVLCITIVGSLLSYLRFNLPKNKKKKIFMGDTGTMFLGLLISFISIKFLNLFDMEYSPNKPVYVLQSAPVVSIAILIIPIIDTLSVTTIRLINKKPPFSADKNHTHHRFLALGLSHIQTSLIMGAATIIIIGVTYLLRMINVNYLLAIILILGVIFCWSPIFFKKKKRKKVYL